MMHLKSLSVLLIMAQLSQSTALNAYSNCGIRSDYCPRKLVQVSGGVNACKAMAPWNVIIEKKQRLKVDSDDKLIDVHCGGSLVTLKHAVTAAHCFMRNKYIEITGEEGVCPKSGRSCGEPDDNSEKCPRACTRTKPSDLTVYVGKTIRRKKDPVSVKSIHIHPDWKRSLLGDKLESEILHDGVDIAVLELDYPLLGSIDSVWPVCLPVSNDRYMYKPNEKLDLYGFGFIKYGEELPRVLQVVTLNIKSTGYCRSQYNGKPFKNLVCSLGEEVKNKRQSGSCNGDSGSGAVSQRRTTERYVLAAVVSFGIQDCGKEKRVPNAMTKVLNHVDWIRKIIGKCEGFTEDGKQCKFPFLYNGTQHDCCTTQDSEDERSWCVTELDAFGRNNKDPGTWGYCTDDRILETSIPRKRTIQPSSSKVKTDEEVQIEKDMKEIRDCYYCASPVPNLPEILEEAGATQLEGDGGKKWELPNGKVVNSDTCWLDGDSPFCPHADCFDGQGPRGTVIKTILVDCKIWCIWREYCKQQICCK